MADDCSNHMTGNKNSFVNFNENIKSHITLDDGRSQDVVGKGTIAIKTKSDSTKFVQDALYVLGLAQNLFSVSQLLQRGYMVNFHDDKCLLCDKKKKEQIASVLMALIEYFPCQRSTKLPSIVLLIALH